MLDIELSAYDDSLDMIVPLHPKAAEAVPSTLGS
jgi:hypothetical protein